MTENEKFLNEVETRYSNLMRGFRQFSETYQDHNYEQDFTDKFQHSFQELNKLITNYCTNISDLITARVIVSRDNLPDENWRIFHLAQRYRAIVEANYNTYKYLILPEQTSRT